MHHMLFCHNVGITIAINACNIHGLKLFRPTDRMKACRGGRLYVTAYPLEWCVWQLLVNHFPVGRGGVITLVPGLCPARQQLTDHRPLKALFHLYEAYQNGVNLPVGLRGIAHASSSSAHCKSSKARKLRSR